MCLICRMLEHLLHLLCPDGYISFTESKLSEEQPLSAESLRESLKKELEFCFSRYVWSLMCLQCHQFWSFSKMSLINRENLSKDLYLISQMDSDQFVPIWTIASMEGIKVLTTDMDLILDVLRCEWHFVYGHRCPYVWNAIFIGEGKHIINLIWWIKCFVGF